MVALPQQGSGRLTAVLLLVVVLILVYLLCFHWFILQHREYSTEIADLSEQLGRFQRVAAQRPQYENLLRALQERRSDESLFLEGGDFNEAAAEMSERLSQMVSTQAEESCQIVSRQPVRPRAEERFQKVTVNVRMRCGIGDLQKILYSLETSVPMVIADDLTIIQPRARSRARRNRNQEQTSPTALDIRFNMSGYLPGGVES
jgi:general secretion pathway protein M